MVRGWISRILKIHRIFCCTRFVEKGMANIEGTYYIYLAVSTESRDIAGLFKIKHCLDGEHRRRGEKHCPKAFANIIFYESKAEN